MKWFVFLVMLHAFGQNTLKPNLNSDAKELIHRLNKTKDTLVLSSQHTIKSVAVLNALHQQMFPVNARCYQLPLDGILKGKNVIVVRANKKLIVFQILKE